MKLVVNGAPRSAGEGATLLGLLEELGIDPAQAVVEHNGRILERGDDQAALPLREGDILEIAHFVGGG